MEPQSSVRFSTIGIRKLRLMGTTPHTLQITVITIKIPVWTERYQLVCNDRNGKYQKTGLPDLEAFPGCFGLVSWTFVVLARGRRGGDTHQVRLPGATAVPSGTGWSRTTDLLHIQVSDNGGGRAPQRRSAYGGGRSAGHPAGADTAENEN